MAGMSSNALCRSFSVHNTEVGDDDSAPATPKVSQTKSSRSFGGFGGTAVSQGSKSFKQTFVEFRAEASPRTVVSIIVAMSGALMFGIDQNNWGMVKADPGFVDTWCTNQPMFNATAAECQGDNPPVNFNLFRNIGLNVVPLFSGIACLTRGLGLSGRCGHRMAISVGAGTCFVGTLLASYLSFKSILVFMLGRVLTGFGCGIACFALPIYSSEVATPTIRGSMGSMFQWMCALGGVAMAILKILLPGQPNLGLLSPGIVGVILCVSIWTVPESPRFVLDKKGPEAAKANLRRLRKGEVDGELADIQRQMEAERHAGEVTFAQAFTRKGLRWRVFVGATLQFCQQFTGVNGFLGNADTIWADAGLADQTEVIDLVFQITMLVGCTLGLFLMDSALGGRKCQLLVASALCMLPLLVSYAAQLGSMSPFVTVGCVVVYGFGFQIGWGIVPWVYPAELFATSEKETSMSICTFMVFVSNVGVGFLATAIFDQSLTNALLVFAVFCSLDLLFVLCCVKETKGLSVRSIVAMFDGRDSLNTQLSTTLTSQP